MILGEFGRLVRRGNTLCTPEWLIRETAQITGNLEAERRLRELRNSLALASIASRQIMGDTIIVKLPKRFASTDPVCDTESIK